MIEPIFIPSVHIYKHFKDDFFNFLLPLIRREIPEAQKLEFNPDPEGDNGERFIGITLKGQNNRLADIVYAEQRENPPMVRVDFRDWSDSYPDYAPFGDILQQIADVIRRDYDTDLFLTPLSTPELVDEIVKLGPSDGIKPIKEIMIRGAIDDVRSLFHRIENEYISGWQYAPDSATLLFSETKQPTDRDHKPIANRAAWKCYLTFTEHNKNYWAGIEVYQIGQVTEMKFYDDYNPNYNPIDGPLRGLDECATEPIGKIFTAFAELIEQEADKLGLLMIDQERPRPKPISGPWEKIPDKSWHREALRLWWGGMTAGEIASKIPNVEEKTVRNQLSILRKTYGEDIVPHKSTIRKSGYSG